MTLWVKPPFAVRLSAYAPKDIQKQHCGSCLSAFSAIDTAISTHSLQSKGIGARFSTLLTKYSNTPQRYFPQTHLPQRYFPQTHLPQVRPTNTRLPQKILSTKKRTGSLQNPQRPSSPQPSSQSTPRRPSTVRHPPFPIQGLTTAYSTPKTTRTVHQPHEQLA